MLKKFFIILFASILMLGICESVLAADDTQTATSTINGVTINWSYKLNESNQIEELKCTNTSDLTGNITVPSTIDGKTVVTLGYEAFRSATQITGITIPSTVKEIGISAFSGCTSLSSVNLGNVEKISDQSFRNCTALTSIKIPKTLIRDASGAPFSGCTNLTSIVLEDGMTVVPNYLCANTPITEITIPSTVKEIGVCAFSGCTSLSSVNLGNVEKISDQSFRNCTALTSIKIPKTLIRDASGAPFSGCTNLTSIVLEDGMTVVPDYLCSKTPITEITIPNTVKEIGIYAFKSCNMLKKITILDNVENMEGYVSSSSDLVFQNHNEDLTIYCYKDSMADKYATKYNIKCVYLTKIIDTKPAEEDKKDSVENPKVDTSKADTTVATGKLPQTGVNMGIVFVIISIMAIAVAFYKKYSNYKDIK